MRPILLIVAAIAVFFIWDGLANDGRQWKHLKRNIEQAENFHGLVRVSWN